MAGNRRTTRAVMMATAYLHVPWAVSLTLRAHTITRARAITACGAVVASTPRDCGSRKCMLRQRTRISGSARAGSIVGDDVSMVAEARISSSVAADINVDEKEMLDREEWMARAEAHRTRIRAMTNGSVHHDQNDPIFNFLFEYYHLKPRMLLQWTPGIGVYLLDADPSLRGCPLPGKAWESAPGPGGYYKPSALGAKRLANVHWIRTFLQETTSRAPVFHCFGLHEWAMLYRPPGAETDARSVHQTLPFRVSQEEINAMVEGRGGSMACTHFDAFRFFTPEAKPLNSIQLERKEQNRNDQPGCIHANMDLFKWTLKLWPLLPSELMADALELAVACRMLDMRASPYDLGAYGQEPDGVLGKGGLRAGSQPPESWDPTPVMIETEHGRKEYQQAQLDLYSRSLPVRRQLLNRIDRILEAWTD